MNSMVNRGLSSDIHWWHNLWRDIIFVSLLLFHLLVFLPAHYLIFLFCSISSFLLFYSFFVAIAVFVRHAHLVIALLKGIKIGNEKTHHHSKRSHCPWWKMWPSWTIMGDLGSTMNTTLLGLVALKVKLDSNSSRRRLAAKPKATVVDY